MIFAWSYVATWAENSWVLWVLGVAFWLQTIRRLHDIDRTGWWVAAAYLAEMSLALLPATYPDVIAAHWAPLVFPIVALSMIAALPGSRGDNRFGAPGRKPRSDQASRIPDHPSH